MPCLVALFALISPRLALVALWLFSNVLSRAYDGWLVPLIGFFVLPWTTLAYAVMWNSGTREIAGFEWFIVGFAFVVDVGSYAFGRRARSYGRTQRSPSGAERDRAVLVTGRSRVRTLRSAVSSTTSRTRDLAVDRLPQAGASLEVLLLEDASFGADSDCGPRRPHRHDYHELIWTRRGRGHHLLDGEVSAVEPGTVTLIGRGQVHVFERASGLYGAVVRFGDEMLHGDAASGANPWWLLAGRSVRRVPVPPGEAERLEATIGALAAETRRPPDSRSVDVERHLLAALLLWMERWYEATRTEQRDRDDAELQLYRRFADVLERDFARHADARHYADELRVPPASLSRALADVTGRATKELITDRRMLEAARLLRFTDLSVGEVAFRAGYSDQLYFSRAFKRHHGEAPMAYRERLRGRPARAVERA